ncbi:MAG: helix-turn-helix domain-containing protein [Phycisphaerae bacterium]|nr:helix-turn-helix domain-containing protein [Phycisphaerae bacterium]
MKTQANATSGRTVGPEPRPATNAELLDVRAVATLLDCSPRHIYRLSDVGRMPRPVKLGQLVRWRRAVLMEWLDAGCPSVRSVRGGAR